MRKSGEKSTVYGQGGTVVNQSIMYSVVIVLRRVVDADGTVQSIKMSG